MLFFINDEVTRLFGFIVIKLTLQIEKETILRSKLGMINQNYLTHRQYDQLPTNPSDNIHPTLGKLYNRSLV